MEKDKLCKDCVNFIFADTNETKIDCDYENFLNEKISKAILYTPEIFDCEEYEYLEE